MYFTLTARVRFTPAFFQVHNSLGGQRLRYWAVWVWRSGLFPIWSLELPRGRGRRLVQSMTPQAHLGSARPKALAVLQGPLRRKVHPHSLVPTASSLRKRYTRRLTFKIDPPVTSLGLVSTKTRRPKQSPRGGLTGPRSKVPRPTEPSWSNLSTGSELGPKLQRDSSLFL